LTLVNERHWSLVPMGVDLYGGVPGVALFLAYLGEITGEGRYTALAQAALMTLRRQVEPCVDAQRAPDRDKSKSLIPSIGGFSGWGGVIYTLTHLGVLWNQPELLSETEAIVEWLPALIESDEQFDVIGGAAGCIGSLISLYRCTPSERILDMARQCGDRLIARAQPMERGIGWVAQHGGAKPLAGFSHGAAGMAWALLELAALTGEQRFRTSALDAIAYERSLFSPEAGNWPDLREFETSGSSFVLGSSPVETGTSSQASRNGHGKEGATTRDRPYMTAWCHGAPGIGLARLATLQHLDDEIVRAEIDTAVKTTLAQGFGGNHSLCHGDLGNLELLIQAGQTLDDLQWRAHVERMGTVILNSIDEHGWLCGVPLGVETPGLMTGLAGIGYGLLRLAEPARVPSVLTLDPPIRHP
jgi:type 2 lantibiotic biosynthesis protein LanM